MKFVFRRFPASGGMYAANDGAQRRRRSSEEWIGRNLTMNELDQHLSGITTHWTLLRKAHGEPSSAAQQAQQELMEQYLGAVYRYLFAIARDYQTADELTQEFAVRFLSGRYRNANPERGRFRDYVKRCLFHLVRDFRSRQGKSPTGLSGAPNDIGDVATPGPSDDQTFLESWRSELLDRAWAALAQHEQTTDQPYYAVLRFRADHPEVTSDQMAQALGERLGRTMTAENSRQLLRRARERFGELLMQETSRSLGDPGLDRVEEELADLRLLIYCRDAIQRRRTV